MKSVAVVLRAGPADGDRLAEGLRNAVGLTSVRENRVTVYLVGAALGAVANPAPALRRPIEALFALRTRIVVEAESIAAAGDLALGAQIEVLPREQVFAEITAAAAVVSW